MEGVLISELKGYARFVSEQPPYNLLDRRIERTGADVSSVWPGMSCSALVRHWRWACWLAAMPRPRNTRLDLCAQLRGGIYAERVTAQAIAAGNQFVQLAREHGCDPAQLALLWVKRRSLGITAPLIGVRSVAQLEHLLPGARLAIA